MLRVMIAFTCGSIADNARDAWSSWSIAFITESAMCCAMISCSCAFGPIADKSKSSSSDGGDDVGGVALGGNANRATVPTLLTAVAVGAIVEGGAMMPGMEPNDAIDSSVNAPDAPVNAPDAPVNAPDDSPVDSPDAPVGSPDSSSSPSP